MDPGARGQPSPPRGGRPAAYGLAGLLVAVGVGWAAWSAFVAAGHSITPQVLGWTAGERAVQVRVSVDHPRGAASTCTVRALGRDASTVGELRLPVDGSGRHTEATTTVPTTSRAFSVEVADCVRR